MATINNSTNHTFIFPKGTIDKINKKLNKKSYTEIKYQANILRKHINKKTGKS